MNQEMTVHMIGSAHIDPVWLWKWQAGVVEALSTCRTAVELLERHPKFVFTRSDVWIHEIVERYDPELFAQIRQLAANGRWYPAGGWYIQPDCNLPLAESYQRHIDYGKRYFGEKLGMSIDVGFNVDSFGHNASLPDILSRNGYDSYVMMRPGPGEKELPSELFLWKGANGGVIRVWRIQNSYNASTVEALERNIDTAINAAPDGIHDAMCFYGIGDHGGGPTEELIQWIEDNENYKGGARLEFSHPRNFFDRIRESPVELTVVDDELQMHAIGCYTVVAEMKQTARRAEYSLIQAENALQSTRGSATRQLELDDAWKLTLFNQFHDTLANLNAVVRRPYAPENAEQ